MATLKAVGPESPDDAPVLVQRSSVVSAPVQAVSAPGAADPLSWGPWCRDFSSASRWSSPPPFGVGSERTMRAFGSDISEETLAWVSHSRWVIRIKEAGMGTFSAFVEDRLFEPTTPTSARMTWSVAADGRPPKPIPKTWVTTQISTVLRIATRRLGTLLSENSR